MPGALALLLAARGPPDARAAPAWIWLGCVLLVDVAHVWGTGLRVYADAAELRRRPWLYAAVPVAAWLAGVACHARGPMVFWRALAYVAALHFVRQQSGFMALYRRRGGDCGGPARACDTAAVYAATLYPLVYWHTHLPRAFAWMLPGDFAPLAPRWERPAWLCYVASLAAYGARAAWLWGRGRGQPGRDLLLLSTATCWYVGIVATDDDITFTVTNVLLHGLPYMALLVRYGQARRAADAGTRRPRPWHIWRVVRGPRTMLAALWAAAFLEELLWDRGVWHERSELFGAGWQAAAHHVWLVPLLAVPQLTLYVLDGVVWRRRANPVAAAMWGAAAAAEVSRRGPRIRG